MWQHIQTIAWVQFRTIRNHLPRTTFGAALMWFLSLLWYGIYAAAGVAAAVILPHAQRSFIERFLPAALLIIAVVWQIVPLVTLSAGWSLELRRLQVYPVRTATLFVIEIVLRLTNSPEMILVLLGIIVGLLRHPRIPAFAPVLLLLYIPFNLFLSLALREVVLNSISRGRLREIGTLVFISLGILPQLLIRSMLGPKVRHVIFLAAHARGAPWLEMGSLGIGSVSFSSIALILIWIALTYGWAKRQFAKSLLQDEVLGRRLKKSTFPDRNAEPSLLTWPSRFFSDPLAALIEKELRSLVRMPRFRVIFGMACIFSVLIFIPMVLRDSRVGFIADNFLPMVTVYGLLLLGEVLLFNVFGFDRRAVQIYFVTPVPFRKVITAKNVVAVIFIVLQTASVMLIAGIARIRITPASLGDALGIAAVVSMFFLAAGNLTSVAMPKAMNPNQTFRKQAGGKLQLWVMVSFLGLSVPVGMAYLAGWALQNHWAFWGVLLIDFVIGVIVYRLAIDSAVERGTRDRERIVDLLSQGADPVGV